MVRTILAALLLCVAISCSDSGDDPEPRVCTEVEFECADHSCIPLEETCDGSAQCPDESDEGGGTCAVCDDGQEACDDGTCIDESDLCDGAPQCADASDEDPELCADYCPGDLSDDGSCME